MRTDPGARLEPNAGLAHAVLALGGFSIGTTEFATMSFLPAFTAELGVDAPTGGHVVSAYALGVVVGAPLLAILGARVERRLFLMLLLSWFALGNILSSLAPNLESLVISRSPLRFCCHGARWPWPCIRRVSRISGRSGWPCSQSVAAADSARCFRCG